MNKGQGLIEYLLITILAVVVVLVLLQLLTPMPSGACDKSKPTAGDVVNCIATRTAEAKNR